MSDHGGWDRSDGSDRSDRPKQWKPLRPSGGYLELRTFRLTTVIYDATDSFCKRFMDPHSRTVDQMVQAARSGRQNIAEGSRAAASSSQTELRLTNVARFSLDELLLDYQDFLRQRRLRKWAKNDPEALEVRAVGQRKCGDQADQTDQSDQSDRSDRSDPPSDDRDRRDYEAYSRWLDHEDPAIVANALICLINQANYLLQRQIAALERDFVENGGYSEQLAAARIAERRRRQSDPPDPSDPSDQSDPTDHAIPKCPLCGKLMTLRTARKGPRAGNQFWGCTAYPDCKGSKPV